MVYDVCRYDIYVLGDGNYLDAIVVKITVQVKEVQDYNVDNAVALDVKIVHLVILYVVL